MGRPPDRFDRRRFLALAGVGAPLALAACSSSGSGSGSTASDISPGISSASPRRGGSINIGVSSEIDGFDPASSHLDASGLTYANALFDSLTRVTRSGGWKPYLAQSVTPNTDLTVWTITLRPNVVFHDGSPLNADVALANFHALQTSALTAQTLGPVSGISKTGDLSYQITLDYPVAAFPYSMATQLGYVVALSQLNNPNGSKQPVGTGPFKLVEWVPNDHLTVTKNPHYWRPGLPYLDTVTFKPIAEDAQRENSLRSGSIDLMHSHDPNVIKDLAHAPGYQLVNNLTDTVGEPDMDFIILNCSIDPTNDLTVRQALAHALDIAALNKVFGAGVTKPQTSPFNAGSPYRSPNNHYPNYDPATARQLVAQAKPNHGGSISLTLGTIPDPRLVGITQAIQQMWQQVGIEVKLAQYQQATFIDNMVEGTFQAYTDEQFAAPDPDLNYVWWSDTTANPPIALNFARNKDPQLEQALQTGRRSSDPSVRAQAYQQVDDLLAKDLPYLWISQAPWSLTGTDKVQNFDNPIGPDGTPLQGFLAGVFDPTPIWLT